MTNSKETAKTTAIRCKDCKWIHEADSEHPENNFMGVELCGKHRVNEALLEACREAYDLLSYIQKHIGVTTPNDNINTVVDDLSTAINQVSK